MKKYIVLCGVNVHAWWDLTTENNRRRLNVFCWQVFVVFVILIVVKRWSIK